MNGVKHRLVCLLFILLLVAGLISYNCINSPMDVFVKQTKENKTSERFVSSSQPLPGSKNNNNSRIWQEQRLRLKRLHDICSRLNRTETITPPKKYSSRLLVDDTSRVLFGYIPKVGCKTWKQVFGRIRRAHGGNQPNLGRLSSFDEAGREKRLREFRKVLFVRDPFIRLLSAFLSKFRNFRGLQRTWENMYGLQILTRYRPGSEKLVNKVQSVPKLERPFINVTLTEFIRFIVDLGDQIVLHEISDHWLPQHIVSHVCELGFDFVGKYENLAVEAPFVLEWLNLTSVAGFPDVHSSAAANAIAEEYSHVPLKYLQRLQKYYRLDFELFGYDPTDIIPKTILPYISVIH